MQACWVQRTTKGPGSRATPYTVKAVRAAEKSPAEAGASCAVVHRVRLAERSKNQRGHPASPLTINEGGRYWFLCRVSDRNAAQDAPAPSEACPAFFPACRATRRSPL